MSFSETPDFIDLSRLQLPSKTVPRGIPSQVDSLLSIELPLAISDDAQLLSSSGSDPVVSSESNSQEDSENV